MSIFWMPTKACFCPLALGPGVGRPALRAET
jgi:hypothetical protein